jgi:hypothetical protein
VYNERQGDKYIMDAVCSPTTAMELDRNLLQHYTDAEIRQLYYCKSYLKVKKISELCNADGVFIIPSILKGELSIGQCASKLEDIRHERPSENYVAHMEEISVHTIHTGQENKRYKT